MGLLHGLALVEKNKEYVLVNNSTVKVTGIY